MKLFLKAVAVVFSCAMFMNSVHADWKPMNANQFILCDTKKNAKKYDYPTRTTGCRAITTGPYQAKCVKSCMFGIKKYTFAKPTQMQISGYNSGEGLSGLASFTNGKYPASNRALSAWYGKSGWVKKCPLGICNHY